MTTAHSDAASAAIFAAEDEVKVADACRNFWPADARWRDPLDTNPSTLDDDPEID